MSSVPRLHLISDRRQCPVERLPEVARAVAAGGAGAVHIRERELTARELMDLASEVKHALDGTDCRLFVNDRVDIVALAGAHGVQLPEHGIPADQARRLLPPGTSIGVSVHSVEGAVAAQAVGAEFVIAGHVFETGSKPGQAGRGTQFVREVASAVEIPVIAIGGITPERTGEVIRAGAHGVAAISALLTAEDPAEAARAFIRAIEGTEVMNDEGSD